MDSRIIKSAGMAAIIIIFVELVVGVVGNLPPDYILPMVILLINYFFILPPLYYFLLGFLPVYFFRKLGGEITSTNCVALLLLAIIFHYTIGILLPKIFGIIYPYLIVFPPQFYLKTIYTLFLMIPAIIGTIIGFSVFSSKVGTNPSTGKKNSRQFAIWAIIGFILGFIFIMSLVFVYLSSYSL